MSKCVGGYIIKTRRLYVKKTGGYMLKNSVAIICFILFCHQFSDDLSSYYFPANFQTPKL